MLRRVIVVTVLLALTTLATGARFNCEGGSECEVLCF